MTVDPETFIRANTAIAAPSLLPELRLHLATEITPIWQATEDLLRQGQIPPPYWAFAWAGGQALARFLLDEPAIVTGKRVLDFGAGSGLVSLAAAKAGAAAVTAAEIDPFAAAAIRLNMGLNASPGLPEIAIVTADLIDERPVGERPDGDGAASAPWDVILVGDMCYEQPLADRLTRWLRRLTREGALVLLGDPGRSYVPREGRTERMRYTVPTSRELEDRDSREGIIWELAG